MAAKKSQDGKVARWLALDEAIAEYLPQVASVYRDEGEFIGLYLKQRDDGTTLAIAKRYGVDGGPMVCFGSGYGVSGALLGLEGAIAANRWRPDKYPSG